MLKIILFQPEIAGNVGTIIRCCACFNAEFHVIEPLGFPFDLQRIKRSAMDYIDSVKIFRHSSFKSFYDENILNKNNRLILASTKGTKDVQEFKFQNNDFSEEFDSLKNTQVISTSNEISDTETPIAYVKVISNKVDSLSSGVVSPNFSLVLYSEFYQNVDNKRTFNL